MTTIHFEGKFKGKFGIVPHCTRWSMSPKSGQTTQNLAEVTCTRCAKQLDIAPAAKPVVVEKNKTGTCPCCFHSQKTKSTTQKMFNHGYERPGFGYTVGGCYGPAFLPYELSVEGTVYMLEQVRNALTAQTARLAALQDATEITVKVGTGGKYVGRRWVTETMDVVVKSTDSYTSSSGCVFEGTLEVNQPNGRTFTVEFASHHTRQVKELERIVKQIQSDIEMFTQKVAEWKLVEGF